LCDSGQSAILRGVKTKSLMISLRQIFPRTAAFGWLALIALTVLVNSATAATITKQPIGGVAATNESFAFSVEATGSGTLTYQWARNNSNIGGQTNATLLLTNIVFGSAGSYSVKVTDSSNSVTSTNVSFVVTSQPRKVTTGVISGGGQAQVELLLIANGRENAVMLSLGYLTNILTNPAFTSAFPSATTTVDTSQAGAGLVGLTFQLPAGQMLTNGPVSLGFFTFDFVSGNNPFAGGYYFTNAPAAVTAMDTNAHLLVLAATVLPSVQSLGAPALNLQSGLFQQQVVVGNGGQQALASVQTLVYGLGDDSKTNAIRLFNAQSQVGVDWNQDGRIEFLPLVQISNLTNGESRQLTLEYYVSDHSTVPTAGLMTLATNAFTFRTPPGNSQSVTRTLYTNGVFLIEFNSKSNAQYYIQYAATPGDLMNNGTVKTAFPFVTGTGSRMQWLDTGPPKTDSPPTDGGRFYRVLSVGQ